ncbi:hypothetical protein SAMN05444003_0892 [Cognatiyoonia sediminum]|uniref:Invasion protein IalB, involved in pathogenesis n=1 Tax=Cognatiyoonia sediminum TaxID=1508389 RepID=A0A1M5ML50_9RHOB|nr:hypothetical protein [Cognatiyoonia sediminum]SHG78110.1 hypothetical protein SAMN05444003_0892 [Cognatiyoonia sediminum]
MRPLVFCKVAIAVAGLATPLAADELEEQSAVELTAAMTGSIYGGAVAFDYSQDGCSGQAALTQTASTGASRTMTVNFGFSDIEPEAASVLMVGDDEAFQLTYKVREGVEPVSLVGKLVEAQPSDIDSWLADGATCEGNTCNINKTSPEVALIVFGPGAMNRAEGIEATITQLVEHCRAAAGE